MDHAFQGRHPPRRLAAMVAAHQPPSDVSWFSDTSVTHHITSDLDNLSIHRPYRGSDSVQVGNGQGLSISHVGSATLHIPTFTFRLHNVLIDDFSRYCWIYPLLFKSHVFTIFCTFKAYVENLLDLKIKTFRSDGGGELKIINSNNISQNMAFFINSHARTRLSRTVLLSVNIVTSLKLAFPL